MQYMRCKCGKCEAWTSMGVPACAGCSECNTTLETHPEHHTTPIPHDWRVKWDIDRERGNRWQYRECTRCFLKEKIDASTT